MAAWGKPTMKKLLSCIILCLLGVAALSFAEEPTETILQTRSSQWVIAVGGSSVLFDSSFKYLDNETGNGFYLDPEGQLGLPERQEVPMLTMLVALKDRHFLSIGATRFRRESTLLAVEDLDLGSLGIASGEVDVWINSNDFDLSYGYRFFADDHIRILGKVGIYILDLDAGIHAEGEWNFGDEHESGTYDRGRSLVAPLPLLGVQFNFYINRRWSLSTSVDAMYLPVGDITGRSLRTKIHTRYAFGRTVGLVFGINYFHVHVTDQNETRKYDIKYGYDGVFAGLIFAF
jgi:hypothetical protein